MSEVTMKPETEELLIKVIEHPGKLNRYKFFQLLAQLDKLVQLQMRKLVTLQNLRDGIAEQGRKQGYL